MAQYVPVEDVEKLERYRPGGYHPIAIGECVSGRYYVVHKLGYGSYSTNWLARDKITSKYVAAKIAVATGKSQECDILRRLNASSSDDAATLIPPILDEFILSGPNGEHHCLVTIPARMSLALAKDASYKKECSN